MKILPQSVILESYTPNPEQLIESAGRTCYKSTASVDSAPRFIKSIIERGHESVLEHPSATFRIVCDRGISHEIVRHRLASYSQESTRYCCYAKDKFDNEISVIGPPDLTDVQFLVWSRMCEESEKAYLELLNLGCKPEIARSVLPTCLKTELVMTANFREWRHFLKLRLSKAAHPQIREVAKLILDQLKKIAPNVFEDILVDN